MKRILASILITAVLLALCACGAAAPAESEEAETTASPSAEPTALPTDTPSPAPSEEPEVSETPVPSPTPVPSEEPGGVPSWDALQQTLYDTDSFCAALYLGRSSSASLRDAALELLAQKGFDGVSYLSGFAGMVDAKGDEVYILIPRGDQSLSIYDYVLETQDDYSAYPGELLLSSVESGAFVVRCNESDVRANVVAIFTSSEGEHRFAPRITLRDDSLLAPQGVYVLENN